MAEAPGPELTDDIALEMLNAGREAELAQAAAAMSAVPAPQRRTPGIRDEFIMPTPEPGESTQEFARRSARKPNLGRYVLNSATFGAADPVLAGLTSVPGYLIGKLTGSKESLGDVYSRVRQDLREGERATEEAYGWGAPIAGVVGGVAMGPGVLKMAGQGAGLVGRGLSSVGLGAVPRAVEGATASAGATLGDYAAGRGLMHLLRGAGEGAGAGGLTAAIRQEGSPTESALAGGALGAGIGASLAGAYGLGRFARAVKNQIAPSHTWAEQNARQLLSNSIGSEARMAEMEQALAQGQGRPLTLADVGRENVRSRAEAAYKQPGEGRDEIADLLTNRMAEQPHRVAADLSLTLTPQIDRGAALTIDSLDQMKRRLARPLYDEAYQYGRVATSELEPIVRRLEASGAMDEARRLAAIEGREFTGFDRVGAGSKSIPAIDMRDVDIIQRAIRASEEKAQGEGGRATTLSNAFRSLRESRDPDNPGFLDIIDSFNPKFKQARQVWAEGTGNTDAINLGRKMLSAGNETRFDDALREFKRLRPGERDYFRLGLAQDIVDRMAKVSETADAAKTLLTPRMQNRMRQFFEKPGDFDTFLRGLQQEALMGRTGQRVMGGSRTQQLAAEQGAMNTEALMRAGAAFASGDYRAFLRSILSSTFKHLNSPTMDRKTATELQRILFNPNKDDNLEILNQIRQMRAGRRPDRPGFGGEALPLPEPVVDLSRALATQPMLQAPQEGQ